MAFGRIVKPAAGRERKWDMGLRAEWPCLLPATLITTLHDILFPKNARKSQQAFFILFRGSFVMLLSSQSWEHWQLLSFWFAISVYIMQELQGCCNPLWINESHKGLNWRMLRSFLPLYLGCWQQPHIEPHDSCIMVQHFHDGGEVETCRNHRSHGSPDRNHDGGAMSGPVRMEIFCMAKVILARKM